MKNIAQLYSLLMCSVSTIVTLVAAIYLIIAIINITFFDLRHEGALKKYNDNESYTSPYYSSYGSYNLDRERMNGLTYDELTALRIQNKSDYILIEKSRITNNIIDYTVYVIVSLLFTLIHYIIYRKCVRTDCAVVEANVIKTN